ncbi:helix-turn-helix transcriptional regulator [Actinomadura litoris]|uniref:helix-turn-helix transcriptional regulator n=1 Tax=Actinomadura litoris TaxID=2678616 RepID=UPI0035568EF4
MPKSASGARLRDSQLLRALIAARGLTQVALARAVGCTKQMIGHLVNGVRTGLSRLLAVKISRVLKVRPSDLFHVAHTTCQSRKVLTGVRVRSGGRSRAAGQAVPRATHHRGLRATARGCAATRAVAAGGAR